MAAKLCNKFQVKGSAMWVVLLFISISCTTHHTTDTDLSRLKVSENRRFLITNDSTPFFWLGDTGWFIFFRLTQDEADKYLDDRKAKGFNIIQTMLLRHVWEVNAYGDSALINQDVSQPLLTEGSDFADTTQYDYWDHVDYVIDKAMEKGLYVALTPVWGSNVKQGKVTITQAEKYAKWLGERYKNKTNIIWLNGGDIKGSDSTQIWTTIGNTLKNHDLNHLVTYHPYGRDQSSTWFHNEPWLDFNMFQSGHERYDQDKTAKNFGEDNWRYVTEDYNKIPVRPTIDGEPSYEGIPQGLHDPAQPYWSDQDVRRYAYWSVFAGACGFTYGHNAVFQFYKPGVKGRFSVKEYWYDAIDAPGAQQMIYLKNLMLSRPYLERIPDASLVAEQGDKYDYLIATRGKAYAFIYTANGRNISIQMGKISGERVRAWWYNPRNGESALLWTFANSGIQSFDPPGNKETGNDWILVIDDYDSSFYEPGVFFANE